MFKKSIGGRLLAYIIDSLIIFIFVGGILNLLFGIGEYYIGSLGFNFNLQWHELALASLIYYLPIAIWNEGKTIGKMLINVEVRNSSLGIVDKKSIIVRELIKSLLQIISLISFIFVLVRKDRKSIHDLFVDTIVIRKINKSDYIDKNVESNKEEA